MNRARRSSQRTPTYRPLGLAAPVVPTRLAATTSAALMSAVRTWRLALRRDRAPGVSKAGLLLARQPIQEVRADPPEMSAVGGAQLGLPAFGERGVETAGVIRCAHPLYQPLLRKAVNNAGEAALTQQDRGCQVAHAHS